MTSQKWSKKSELKKRDYTTVRQQALIKNIPTSKTHSEAAVKAGYPVKNARQSAYQALQQMRGRVPDLMDQLGLSEEHLIDKHLRRHLNAKRILFFQKDGKVKSQRTVEALEIQSKAIDMGFLLHGSYAPRDPKEAAQFGVRIIRNDIPRPATEFNQFIDVIPESALSRHGVRPNGNPEQPTNGTPPTTGKPPKNGDAP